MLQGKLCRLSTIITMKKNNAKPIKTEYLAGSHNKTVLAANQHASICWSDTIREKAYVKENTHEKNSKPEPHHCLN